MSRVLIEASLPTGRKFDGIPSTAGWLHVCGLLYAAHNRTDGFIPEGRVTKLTNDPPRVVKRAIDWLTTPRPGCDNPLWEPVDGGWLIHDYLDPTYANPTRNEGETIRKLKANAGQRGGIASVESRRLKYGTAQPNTNPEANPEAGASKHPNPKHLSTPEAPLPSPPLHSTPLHEEPNGSSPPRPPLGGHDEEATPGTRLIAAINDILGRALSASDIEKVHGWPYEFRHLSESEIVTEVRAVVENYTARGQPVKNVALFEGRLRDHNARKVDDRLEAQRRPTNSLGGMARAGDIP